MNQVEFNPSPARKASWNSHDSPPSVSDSSTGNEEENKRNNVTISKEDSIEAAWDAVKEGILTTKFTSNFNFNKTSIGKIHKDHFAYKLQDFFPEKPKGTRKDSMKKQTAVFERLVFASTTIENIKKEVTDRLNDEAQILKAYSIITNHLLNEKIPYLPKIFLIEILDLPPTRKSELEIQIPAANCYRFKCDMRKAIDIIRSLPTPTTDEEVVQKLIIPGLRKMIVSNCNKKLRNTQTWGARIMRYANYVCALILIVYPEGNGREEKINDWVVEHTDKDGKLTKLPTWEVVCRFFSHYDLINVEKMFRDNVNKEANPRKEVSDSNPEQGVTDSNLEEEGLASENPKHNANQSKDKTLSHRKLCDIYQKRYDRLNHLVYNAIIEVWKDVTIDQSLHGANLSICVPNIRERAFVADLFSYVWKFHNRLKKGIWHHEHADIGNKPIKKNDSKLDNHDAIERRKKLHSVIKDGVHEEEYEFMEIYLGAETLLSFDVQKSKYARLKN